MRYRKLNINNEKQHSKISINFETSNWINTPFFIALRELVDENIVLWEETEEGYFYWLNDDFVNKDYSEIDIETN